MHADYRLDTQHHGDHTLVTLHGEFDLAASDAMREELRNALDTCFGKRLLIDLTAVAFLDSTALGVLVGAQKRATRDGVHLALVGASRQVQKLLRITQVDRVVTTHPTLVAARSVAAAPPAQANA
jgi:anti-anti-sigma factor